MRIRHGTELLYKKCIFTEIQDGGRRHFEFRKSVSISLRLDQSLPNLMGIVRI